MRRTILSGIWIAVVSVLLAVPAYAYSGTANGGNGGLGNGMGTRAHANDGIFANRNGTRMHAQSNVGTTNTHATSNHDVSVYGTGTGSQFLNVNPHASGMTDRHPGYRTQSYPNDGYRALETTPTRRMGWEWLGLLGLFGLFGMRSRNPQRER